MKTINILMLLLLTSQIWSQNFKYSIVRNDNDYVTYKDDYSPKEAIPKVVVEKFQSIIRELKCDTSNIDFYTYKITVNENITIYSLIINCNLKKNCYFLAYDKTKKAVTDTPINLNIKWSYNNESGFNYKLLKYPLVTCKSIDNNYIICLKERVHNGNVYNAVIEKIYQLCNDLSFKLEFCYEELSLTFDNQIIKRFLDKNIISAYIERDTSYEYVGKTIINPKLKKIIRKECANDTFGELLFTTSGLEDEKVLRNGYSINY